MCIRDSLYNGFHWNDSHSFDKDIFELTCPERNVDHLSRCLMCYIRDKSALFPPTLKFLYALFVSRFAFYIAMILQNRDRFMADETYRKLTLRTMLFSKSVFRGRWGSWGRRITLLFYTIFMIIKQSTETSSESENKPKKLPLEQTRNETGSFPICFYCNKPILLKNLSHIDGKLVCKPCVEKYKSERRKGKVNQQ